MLQLKFPTGIIALLTHDHQNSWSNFQIILTEAFGLAPVQAQAFLDTASAWFSAASVASIIAP
jgi:homospermidine synthase